MFKLGQEVEKGGSFEREDVGVESSLEIIKNSLGTVESSEVSISLEVSHVRRLVQEYGFLVEERDSLQKQNSRYFRQNCNFRRRISELGAALSNLRHSKVIERELGYHTLPPKGKHSTSEP